MMNSNAHIYVLFCLYGHKDKVWIADLADQKLLIYTSQLFRTFLRNYFLFLWHFAKLFLHKTGPEVMKLSVMLKSAEHENKTI